MQKSVYSLVLMDDVVAAIDRIAAREGHEPFQYDQPHSGGIHTDDDAGTVHPLDLRRGERSSGDTERAPADACVLHRRDADAAQRTSI